jgi:hypothetical protein
MAVLAVGLVLSAPARAAIQVRVTYTDGQILEGPLSFGLSALPASVTATILLQGSTTTSAFGPDDVISLSLDFGDAHFTEADLQTLSIVPEPGRGTVDITAFTTLSYQLGGADTPTVSDRLAGNGNFELHLFGVDIDSGYPLHYRYSTSEQIGTLVTAPIPEPTAFIVWSLLGMICGCGMQRSGFSAGSAPAGRRLAGYRQRPRDRNLPSGKSHGARNVNFRA